MYNESPDDIVEELEEPEGDTLLRQWKEWSQHEYTRFCAEHMNKDVSACLIELFGAAKTSTDPVVRGLANRYEILSKTLKLLRAET